MPKPPTIATRVDLLVRDELGELMRSAGFRKTRLVFRRVRGALVQDIQLHARVTVSGGASPPEGFLRVWLGFEAASGERFARVGCELRQLVPEAPGTWPAPPTRGPRRVKIGAEVRQAFEALVARLDLIEDEPQLRRALAGEPAAVRSPDGHALLAEIWARPDDRHVLSVYADWLAANGQPERAEYIQLALLEERTPAQERRWLALVTQHRGAWLGSARPFVYTWEESHETPGFVARARCSIANLVAGFEQVRALGPRLVVSVHAPRAKREVAALAKLPLGTLYGLGFHEHDAQWITDELLATLAPSLRGLRALHLMAGEARASDRGWQAVLAHLDGLEHLELRMGENPERWLELLAESPIAHTLRTLSIPDWIDSSRLALPACVIERRAEDRMRFNRATGYYE